MEQWEVRLQAAALAFTYPPTPDVAAVVRRRLAAEQRAGGRPSPQRRRVAWAAAITVLVIAGLMAVPQVRAAVMEVLRIGAVRIFLVAPTPTAMPVPTATLPSATLTGTLRPTATPHPTPTLLPSLLDLAGETTLADAQAKAGFPILLPTYPPGLGQPGRVFLQDQGGPVVVLVGLDPARPDRVRLSLHELGSQTWGVQKFEPQVAQGTTVNGQPAVWTEGLT